MLQSGQLGDPFLDRRHQAGCDLNARALGQVVHKERQSSGLPDGSVVLRDLVVLYAVEEGGHAADRVHAGPGCRFGHLDGSCRGGGAHVHDVDGAPRALVRRDLGDPAVLVIVQQHALTTSSRQPEAVHTGLDVVLHNLAEGSFVDAALGGHRGDECDNYTAEFRHFQSLLSSLTCWIHERRDIPLAQCPVVYA